MNRSFVYRVLNHPRSLSMPWSLVSPALLCLILINIASMILESVSAIRAAGPAVFRGVEIFSVAVFSIEYLARLWVCTESPKFRGAVRGRLRWATSLMALADLLAVLPFYLPFLGVDLRVFRVLRAMRLARIAKLGRYSAAIQLIGSVVRDRKEELVTTLVMVAMLMLVAASLMYFAESEAQPEAFGSIPAAMWWAVVTLTTVGYGDTYPITSAGRILGAVIALLGIGMVALPTGIIGAGFVEAMSARRHRPCPHCGKHPDEPRDTSRLSTAADSEAEGTQQPE